jgi:cation:H+ antiporter
MIYIEILILILFSFVLIKSADTVVYALRGINSRLGTGVFALSAIILAVGTSLPELFVGITSALEATSDLTFGVVLGSNIANIALICGITALIVGKVNIHGDYLAKDFLIATVAGLLPVIFILDGSLSRVDGLILMSLYAAYLARFLKSKFAEISQEHKKESYFFRFLHEIQFIERGFKHDAVKLFFGIAVLLFSADVIVKTSIEIANFMGISVFVIGLIVIAVGTSLPELAFSFRSLEDHEPSMFFGNILGSTVINSTLILGLTSFIYPIRIGSLDKYFEAVITFLVVSVALWLFVRTKHRLDRWEAGILIFIYIIFAALEFS